MAKTLYVGGIGEEVTEEMLKKVFQTFGDIANVQIPLSLDSQKPRGFGFVEFDLKEDADAARDNLDESELYGRVLRVNLARPVADKSYNQPVWEQHKETIEEGDILNNDEKVGEEEHEN